MVNRKRTNGQKESGRLRTRTALVLATALLGLGLAAAPAQAEPPFFWQSEPGEVGTARGIAADPDTGHVFVSDLDGRRIVEFTAWGEVVKMWGWDVVATGPGDTAPVNEFEICVPADGDECKEGNTGTSGAGQFNSAAGIAIDSAGNVYAVEAGAPRRVQKFSPEGEFLLSFGGGVNQGGGTPENPGNVCTAQHIENGDTCGAGSTGTGPGEFSGTTGSLRTVIAISPDDKVWVGDKNRIQRFNTTGEYQGEIVPKLGGAPQTTQQLAVDSSGFLYASYELSTNDAKPNVYKLNPTTAVSILEFEANNPRAITVADNGDVYVFDKKAFVSISAPARIVRFDSSGERVEEFGGDLSSNSTGLATSSACGIDGVDLFHSDTAGFVRAYGLPPDPDLCPQPEVPPAIVSQSAASVGVTSAALQAEIDPEYFDDTRFYVQYGTAECPGSGWEAGCLEKPAPPGSLLWLEESVPIGSVKRSVAVEGLLPDTTYHFRFVAESLGGGPVFGPETTFKTHRVPATNTGCANQALRSGASATLPDCRAYEMVSPVDKNGADITAHFYEGFHADFRFTGLDQATPGGGKLAYTAPTAFAGAEASPIVSEYIAARGPAGWTTDAIDPPQGSGFVNGVGDADSQYKAFSSDLCVGWIAPESGRPLVSGPTEGWRNLYRRDNCSAPPGFTWLESSAASPEPCFSEPCFTSEADVHLFPELQGFAADGSRALFRVNDALEDVVEVGEVSEDAPREVQGDGVEGSTASQLYLWSAGEGVRLVSMNPDGTPYEGVSTAGSERSTGNHITNSHGRTNLVENALSADGTSVYWTAMSETFIGLRVPGLYLRVNADQPQSAVEEPEAKKFKCAEPEKACTLRVSPPLNGARFWTASADGSRAVFSITKGQITEVGNLYEYEYDEDAGEGARTKIAGQSLGVAGASEDLSHLYFASREAIPGALANKAGQTPKSGDPNLYLKQGESIQFIAALAEEDVSEGGVNGTPSPLASVPRDHVARVTPDGEHLTFVSAAQLTDYDNTDVASGKADREVYLYEAGGELVCASCNPTGARPRGEDVGIESAVVWTAAWIPGYQHQLYGRRPLSADGNRVFFNSIDSLALRDVNGAQDVYQWESPGSGDCTTSSSSYSPQNKGCIDLISTGVSPKDSEFVDASASGDDVFIRTESSLVPSDPGSVDIYDARVNGGFPTPVEPPVCEGDACQSPAPAPGVATPASRAFRGPGNPPKLRACNQGRRAAKLSRRAKGLNRRARRADQAAKAKRLRQRSRRLARRAKGLSNRAKRCRRANRRAGR